MKDKKILVVEDDPATSTLIASLLSSAGGQVETASDGAAMREQLQQNRFDLLMLDLNLPDSDGLELARQVRQISRTGIIIVTERDTPEERAIGLEVGADDYITKPFFPREFMARVRNVLGRVGGTEATPPFAEPVEPPDSLVRFGDWLLDTHNRTLTQGDDAKSPALTPAEMDILIFLARHPHDLHSRDTLGDQIGERRGESQGGRGVDILISRLRRKLGCGDDGPRLIETVRGHGYRFHPRG